MMAKTSRRAQNRALVEGNTDPRVARSVATGIVVGALVGGLVGLAVFALAISGVDELYVAGLLGGGLWGAFLGGFGGLLAKVRWDDAEDQWCEIPTGSVA